MNHSPKEVLVAAAHTLRLCIFVGAVVLTAYIVLRLATMPPAPPGSDGWAHGVAGLVGGVLSIFALATGVVAVILPTVLRRKDPLGFNRLHRRALTGAGVLLGGGFVLGVVFGSQSHAAMGAVLWLGLIVVAAVIVGATLLWRGGGVVFHRFDEIDLVGTIDR